MAGARERFAAACAEMGFAPEVTEYPEGTRTAKDAADAIGCTVAQIVKSLVFDADGEAILALTAGDHRVDTDRLATVVGVATVAPADPEQARAATGYAIGGTPPFGHPAPVRTWVDPALLDHEVVYAAGGTPTDCFPIAPAEPRRDWRGLGRALGPLASHFGPE